MDVIQDDFLNIQDLFINFNFNMIGKCIYPVYVDKTKKVFNDVFGMQILR